MTENDSLQFYLRTLQEKHDLLKECLNGLYHAMALDNHDEKTKANKLLLDACKNLSELISAKDRPNWLTYLIKETSVYSQNHNSSGNNFRLLDGIVSQRHNVFAHKWLFENISIDVDYNFDSLYERFKEESKLSKFFEDMVITLEKMITSGEIDSLKALKSLEQLISVIQQNKEGSYFSLLASWDFITRFMKNLVWQELSNLPGIKQLISAFEKTANDMNVELEDLKNSIAEEMEKKYETTIRSLTHQKKQTDNLLEHDTE